MSYHFYAKGLFVGRYVAFDNISGGDLQVYTDNVGPDRLLTDMPVDQYRRMDPTSPQLCQICASAQEGMAFEEHIIDHQKRGIGQIQPAQGRVFGQLRVGMQHLQVVGVALDLQRVNREFRPAGLTRNVLAQPLSQGLAPAFDAYQCRMRRWRQRCGHKLPRVNVLRARALDINQRQGRIDGGF